MMDVQISLRLGKWKSLRLDEMRKIQYGWIGHTKMTIFELSCDENE